MAFHLEQYWRIRRNIIIRRIEGQFITHSIEPGNEFMTEYDILDTVHSFLFVMKLDHQEQHHYQKH